MTLQEKLKRKKILRLIKSVLLHPPEQHKAVYEINDHIVVVNKLVEDRVCISQYPLDTPMEELAEASASPCSIVKLSDNLARNLFLIEYRLVFLTMKNEYESIVSEGILEFLNDEGKTTFEDVTSGTVCLQKRDGKWIDVGYFDTLSDTHDDIPVTVTRVIPIGKNKEDTVRFILNEIHNIIFFTYNPTVGVIAL